MIHHRDARHDLKKAQAVLFDALLFLIACSLVSTSLIIISPDLEEDMVKNRQSYVDKAHKVFLRSTLHTSLYMESESGRMVVVSHLTMEILEDDQVNRTGIVAWMERTLGNLLPAGMSFRWIASCGSMTLSIGHELPDDLMSLWASRISIPVPVRDDDLTLELMAWYS
jgi:hypothetical protein